MTTTAAPTLTPVIVTDRATNLLNGKTETWGAHSVERTPGDALAPLWRFIRTEDDGTPWWIEHTPTGLTATDTSLRGARRSTAHGLLAVLILNRRADLIRRTELLNHHTEAEAWCECGAPLADHHGTWLHIDGCSECVDVSTGYRTGATTPTVPGPPCCDPCPEATAHVVCARVRPILCDHCARTPARAAECERGHYLCCGCCEPDDPTDFDR